MSYFDQYTQYNKEEGKADSNGHYGKPIHYEERNSDGEQDDECFTQNPWPTSRHSKVDQKVEYELKKIVYHMVI